MIKQKGFYDYLKDNETLTSKITYEEFINSQKSGFDDSGIEKAYEAYKRVLESQNTVS